MLHRHGFPAFGLFLTHAVLSSSLVAGLATPLELTIDTKVEVESEASGCASDLSASPWIHDVMVTPSGGQGFLPAFVQAGIGEVIRFSRRSENITISESMFSDPCSTSHAKEMLPWSANPEDSRSQSLLVVKSLQPQWFTCHQSGNAPNCSSDAVFAINPGSAWPAFAARADMQRGGNLSQSIHSANSSEQVSTTLHHSTDLTAGLSLPSQGVSTTQHHSRHLTTEAALSSQSAGRDVSAGNAWFPWTTTVATVTSLVTF